MAVRLRIVGLALAAALGLALALWALDRATASSPAPRQERTAFDEPLVPAGFRLPPFALRDQDGRTVSLRRFRGHVVVLTFMFSHCRDTCPIMAEQIRGALNELPGNGRDVPVVVISVDPRHDTPASTRRFVAEHHLVGRMHFLMGTRSRLLPIWKGQGIQPKTPTSDHTAFVFLIDRRGVERTGVPAHQLVPERLAHDIRLLQRERA